MEITQTHLLIAVVAIAAVAVWYFMWNKKTPEADKNDAPEADKIDAWAPCKLSGPADQCRPDILGMQSKCALEGALLTPSYCYPTNFLTRCDGKDVYNQSGPGNRCQCSSECASRKCTSGKCQ